MGRVLPVANNGRAVAAKVAEPVAVVVRAADKVAAVVKAADNVVAKAANVRKRLSRPPNTALRSPA